MGGAVGTTDGFGSGGATSGGVGAVFAGIGIGRSESARVETKIGVKFDLRSGIGIGRSESARVETNSGRLALCDGRGRGSGFSASTGVGTENGTRRGSAFSEGAGRRGSDIARRGKKYRDKIGRESDKYYFNKFGRAFREFFNDFCQIFVGFEELLQR